MESLDILKATPVTPKEWLTYYKNIWTKNLMARTIDVKTDEILKAKNPEELVMEYDSEMNRATGNLIPVKERLEDRKLLVEDALALIRGIDELLIVANDEGVDFADKFWSKEALAVAPDMVKKEEPKVITEKEPELNQPSGEAKVD